MSTPTSSRFLHLPAEIRTIIYKETFKNVILTLTPRPRSSNTKSAPGRKPTTILVDHLRSQSLLRVCKSVYHESVDLFWQLATVDSSHDDSHFVSFGLLKGSDAAPPTGFDQNGRLRNLIVLSPFYFDYGNSFVVLEKLAQYRRRLESVSLLASLEIRGGVNVRDLATRGVEVALREAEFGWCVGLWGKLPRLGRMVVSLYPEAVDAIVQYTDRDWRAVARQLLVERLVAGETVEVVSGDEGRVGFVVRR